MDATLCSSTQPAEVLVRSLALVDEVTAGVGRRYRLTPDEFEEFASHVRLKLVEHDYAILRKFRCGGSLKAYLRIVIERLLLDFRTAHWGRWRPSESAKRNGWVGVLLDRLMTRDGLTFDEACTLLQVNYRVAASRDDLYRVSVQLPHRPKRRIVHETPESAPATYGNADGEIMRSEANRQALQVKRALKAAVGRLTPAERRLLDMRFRDGRAIVDIARALGKPARPLYRRMARILRKLGGAVRCAASGLAGANADAFRIADITISW